MLYLTFPDKSFKKTESWRREKWQKIERGSKKMNYVDLFDPKQNSSE